VTAECGLILDRKWGSKNSHCGWLRPAKAGPRLEVAERVGKRSLGGHRSAGYARPRRTTNMSYGASLIDAYRVYAGQIVSNRLICRSWSARRREDDVRVAPSIVRQ
jgi:hypothetical protein